MFGRRRGAFRSKTRRMGSPMNRSRSGFMSRLAQPAPLTNPAEAQQLALQQALQSRRPVMFTNPLQQATPTPSPLQGLSGQEATDLNNRMAVLRQTMGMGMGMPQADPAPMPAPAPISSGMTSMTPASFQQGLSGQEADDLNSRMAMLRQNMGAGLGMPQADPTPMPQPMPAVGPMQRFANRIGDTLRDRMSVLRPAPRGIAGLLGMGIGRLNQMPMGGQSPMLNRGGFGGRLSFFNRPQPMGGQSPMLNRGGFGGRLGFFNRPQPMPRPMPFGGGFRGKLGSLFNRARPMPSSAPRGISKFRGFMR